jgi:hypothetical protein
MKTYRFTRTLGDGSVYILGHAVRNEASAIDVMRLSSQGYRLEYDPI